VSVTQGHIRPGRHEPPANVKGVVWRDRNLGHFPCCRSMRENLLWAWDRVVEPTWHDCHIGSLEILRWRGLCSAMGGHTVSISKSCPILVQIQHRANEMGAPIKLLKLMKGHNPAARRWMRPG